MDLKQLKNVTSSPLETEKFLRGKNCLRKTPPNCPVCSRSMTLVKYERSRIWRCPSHKSEKVSIRAGSYWEKSKLELDKLVEILYFWSLETPIGKLVELSGVSKKTAIQWYQYFRDVCSQWLLKNHVQIGGPGVQVEIDESVVAKRKYNRGHLVKERWVFDGYCPTSGKGFLELVPDRSAPTLLPLVEKYIAPGSVVVSDKWRSYLGISKLEVDPPYTHLDVDHSKNFVDPITGACTNRVEAYWKNCKRRMKYMCGVQGSMLESHLDEFLWREIHGSSSSEAMEKILFQISEWYPTP
jgi:transposase-like protein